MSRNTLNEHIVTSYEDELTLLARLISEMGGNPRAAWQKINKGKYSPKPPLLPAYKVSRMHIADALRQGV